MSSPVAFVQTQPWLSRRACLVAAAAGMAAPWVQAQSGRHITFIVPQPAGSDCGQQTGCPGADHHHVGLHASQSCSDCASATRVRTAMPVPPVGT